MVWGGKIAWGVKERGREVGVWRGRGGSEGRIGRGRSGCMEREGRE